jgi:hypothetical protein
MRKLELLLDSRDLTPPWPVLSVQHCSCRAVSERGRRDGGDHVTRRTETARDRGRRARRQAARSSSSMKSRDRTRTSASRGSNQLSKSREALSAAGCEESGFVVVFVMAWSPVRRFNAG